jgi:signal transduction histidine kinase
MAGHLETNAEALREQHAELVVAKERAEAASRAKTEFLANMSHEIRTPMTAVLGYSDLLLGGEGDKAEREAWAAAVRSNGDRLLDLIDGILDVSRLEADRLAIERRPSPLREVIMQAAGMVRETALAKGLDFSCEIGAECPEAIDTDPLRLRQILASLLRNAVKFTSVGSVRLRVNRAARTTRFEWRTRFSDHTNFTSSCCLPGRCLPRAASEGRASGSRSRGASPRCSAARSK